MQSGGEHASIELSEVTVQFPIFEPRDRLIQHRLARFASGGRIGKEGTHTLVCALNQINLSIREGERVGIIGANGAGKSTLLRVISLIYPPTHGNIYVAGRLGSMLNISLGLNPDLSGRENLFIHGIMLGLTKQETEELIPEVIAFSELGEYIELPVRTYSDGMRMRLLFSIATAVTPDILLMDEWLSAGDDAFRQKAQKRMQDFVNDTGILVLASHSRALLERTCKRVIWLDQGQLRMDGPTDEVCKAYFH